MTKNGLIPYDVIVKATTGDTEAILSVIKHFTPYIKRLSLRPIINLNGDVEYRVDEDMEQELKIELITKIQLFDWRNQ